LLGISFLPVTAIRYEITSFTNPELLYLAYSSYFLPDKRSNPMAAPEFSNFWFRLAAAGLGLRDEEKPCKMWNFI